MAGDFSQTFYTDSCSAKNGVVDGTRTRNVQNHNLGLYH